MQRVLLIALIIATLLAYAPIRRGTFLYEDDVYLSFAQRPMALVDVLQPRGLTILSFRLNGLWHGRDAQGYHAVNVGLHLMLGLAVFGFARTLLPVPYALITAGLTLLHPINSEAVAYVAGRAELIAAIGTVLAVWALSGPVTWTAAGLALLATVVAIGGKELGLMALPLIGLHAIVIRRTPLWRWRTVGWAALGALCAAGLALPILQIRVLGAIEYLRMTERGGWGYLCMQSYALLVLIGNALWPSGLTVDHDYELVTKAGAITAFGVIVVALIATWLLRKRAPLVTFGLWWIVIAILPRFFIRISEYTNEHQVYTAFIGLWIALSAGLMRVNAWLTTSKEQACADSVPSVS